MGGLVVAGVDGSEASLSAVEAAAREARWRGAHLRLVHAFVWPALHAPQGPSPLGPPEGGVHDMVVRLLDEADRRARTTAPDVDVSGVVMAGEALTVLEAQSRAAELVVVGSRGLGSFARLLAGSTAVHLAARGRCPVLVVRREEQDTGPIVVGVDGSAAGAGAVDFAFAEAALRGVGIVALHAWTPWNTPVPASWSADMPYANEPEAPAAREERLLHEALAGRREAHPGVRVKHEVVQGGAREALIEASRTAQLLVVGARGRGGFAGLLLGSVSQAVLQHARCPVAVVRGTADGS